MSAPASEDRSVLSARLDDELSEAERADVDARLASSPEWRAELAEVTVARAALRAAPVSDAPPGGWDALYEAVRALDEDQFSDGEIASIEGARRRRHPLRWAAAVAAAAVAIVVLVLPSRDGVRPRVAVVATQHGTQLAGTGDPVSLLAPVSALGGS